MEMGGKKTVSAEQAELLRQIPSVDELLAGPRLAALSKRVDRNLVVEVARTVLAELRTRIAGDSNWTALGLSAASIEVLISTAVERILSRSLQPVINATGVILHTTWAGRRCRKQSWTNSAALQRSTAISNMTSKQARAANATCIPASC